MKLTETKIKDLPPPVNGKDRLVKDDVQPGLFVRVSAKGARTYLAQYTFAGSKRRIPLGSPTLALARSAAAKIMGEVALGLDPAGERKAKAKAARARAAADELTLAVLLDRWEKLHLVSRRKSYAAEAPRALRVAFAGRLSLPAAGITKAIVVDVLDQLTAAGKPMMGARVVDYGRALYHWALGRDLLAVNPFERIQAARTIRRERVLTDGELRAIWQAAGRPSSVNSIVRILMLTGQRRGEVAGIAWSELSADLSTWTLPASRAKNGVAHDVPLSSQARAIVEAAPRYHGNGLVFPGREGAFAGWNMAKSRLDKACGVEDWTLHDLRRTLATNLQRLGVRLEVTEAVLNHVSGSRAGIVGVYQRHDWADEKRAALQAWADRLEAIVEGRDQASNVVALRA